MDKEKSLKCLKCLKVIYKLLGYAIAAVSGYALSGCCVPCKFSLV